jgi:hypothetical protein
VLVLMIGLLLLGLAAWRLASRTAFADRAVTATAVIDDVDQGPFLQSQDVQRSFTAYATVRYGVDGTLAQAASPPAVVAAAVNLVLGPLTTGQGLPAASPASRSPVR